MKKKQNTKMIDKWQAENVERIVIKPRKDEKISERIQALIDVGKCKSKQAYIIDAVKSRLEVDEKNTIGIPNVVKTQPYEIVSDYIVMYYPANDSEDARQKPIIAMNELASNKGFCDLLKMPIIQFGSCFMLFIDEDNVKQVASVIRQNEILYHDSYITVINSNGENITDRFVYEISTQTI